MPPASAPIAHVVHTGARRIRLRLDKAHRQVGRMGQVRHALQRQPGVRAVEVNETTGSVLIHHDPGAITGDDLAQVLGDIGVLIAGLQSDESGRSDTARAVESALGDLNRRVATASGGKFDLKIVIPGTFLTLGLWKLATDVGSFFTAVPGYVLLYYAFDTYTKLHHLPPNEPASAHAVPPERAAPRGEERA